MRKITDTTDASLAERCVALLKARGIEAEVRDDGAAQSLWAYDEDRLSEAEKIAAEFLANPNDKAFQNVLAPRAIQASVAPRAAKATFRPGTGGSMLTLSLIFTCVVATFATGLPESKAVVRLLYYSEYWGSDFPEIASGQVWRLVTPIFMHGGMLHLLFNMMWLYQLGGAIESIEGPRYFAIATLLCAITVNTAQYLHRGPMFVGMSGVVYALLAYVWMMQRFQMGSLYALSPNTMAFMVIWLVICVIGIIPNVANTQHVVGLGIGLAWGGLRSGAISTWRRRRRYRKSLGD